MVLLAKRKKLKFRQRRSMRAVLDDYRPVSVANPRQTSCTKEPNRISIEDVLSMAEHTREVSSWENRRQVLEEAQRVVRHESAIPDSARPQSVLGCGLQAMTSPLPLSAKSSARSPHMDHIPTLLPLPSDRTFIPSPDFENSRHVNTPVDESIFAERSQSVARQCCEIIGASMCRSCRRLESRMLNREKAEKECPRMYISQQNIAMTQIVKRIFPDLSDDEIQDKIARGEIRRTKFLSKKYRCPRHQNDPDTEDEEVENDSMPEEDSNSGHSNSTGKVNKTKLQVSPHNPLYLLTKLSMKLKGETSTPLFFSNLKAMQTKILSGEVDRKSYMKPKKELMRLKSAVSTISTASSGQSGLTKMGQKLSATLFPTFVSPRKVTIVEEPKYKVYFEPPLLSRRRQIPNPSFFAGSTDEYSLPERLPDVIEFGDSKRIAQLEKQMRSNSSMSFASSIHSEDVGGDPLDKSGSRTARSDRQGSARDQGETALNSARSDDSKSSDAQPGSTMRSFRVSTEAGLSHHEEEKEHEVEAERKSVSGSDTKENPVVPETTAESSKDKNAETEEVNTIPEANLGSPKKDVDSSGGIVPEGSDISFKDDVKENSVFGNVNSQCNESRERVHSGDECVENSSKMSNNTPGRAGVSQSNCKGDEEAESSEEETEILEHLKVSTALEEDLDPEGDVIPAIENQGGTSGNIQGRTGEQGEYDSELTNHNVGDVELSITLDGGDDDKKEEEVGGALSVSGRDGGGARLEEDVLSRAHSVYSSDPEESYFAGQLAEADGDEDM